MSSAPWHKRYHSDALAGFMSLDLEERGAYQTLLDLIYDRGGPIADNERLLSGYMGCSLRKWRAVRDQLLAKGKIGITNDGLITNARAEFELENAAKTARKLAENGSKGGRNKAENAKNINKNSEPDLAAPELGSSLSEARDQSLLKQAAREPGINVPSLMLSLCKAAGISPPDPGRNFARHSEWLQLVSQWIEAGADPVIAEQCVAARAAVMSQKAKTLAYFDMPIRETITAKHVQATEADRLIAEIARKRAA
jgi:uncharacterized protein YdaU (DUF1376 family)